MCKTSNDFVLFFLLLFVHSLPTVQMPSPFSFAFAWDDNRVCVCFDHSNILRPYRLYLVFFCTTDILKGVVRYVWCFLRQRLDIVFLGAKLRKATISFFMSVRPSVRPHGTSRLPLALYS